MKTLRDLIQHLIRINNGPLSKTTLKVVKDFWYMSEKMFFRKYSCTKNRYYKRLMRYGDPYMKSPLAIIAKLLKGN